MLNNLSIDSIAYKEEAHPSDNCPQDVLQQYQFFLTAYFRLSSTDTVNVGIHCFLAHSVGVVYE